MSEQPTVALLGTGTMGLGMGRNIAAAGIPLRAWNRTRRQGGAARRGRARPSSTPPPTPSAARTS